MTEPSVEAALPTMMTVQFSGTVRPHAAQASGSSPPKETAPARTSPATARIRKEKALRNFMDAPLDVMDFSRFSYRGSGRSCQSPDLKPVRTWVPSQNGLAPDLPQRQSVTRFLVS